MATAWDRRLRDTLLKRGFLGTLDDANEHMAKADSTRKSFTEYLVTSGVLKEEDVVCSICIESGLTPILLDHVKFDKELVNILPQPMAESYNVLVISKIGDFLTLAVSDPYNLVALDDLKKFTGSEVIQVVTTDFSIKKNIIRAYRAEEQKMEEFYRELEGEDSTDRLETIEEAEDEEVDISSVTDEESPIVKLVNLIVVNALKRGASDIHIEPFEKYVRLRYRVDGACAEVEPAPPKKMQNAVLSRIKVMSELDIAEKRKPQDGKFRIKFEGREIDFRVSILPVVHGEKAVLRILDSSSLTLNLDMLGFEPKALADFRNACNAAYGMVLVTGPTGSGKSTTLYSAIREVMNIEDNIVTVEDPVEYQLEGVNQVPVNPKRGLTFAGALRSILRQDPDTVMIGEIRDQETAEIAVKAALTGHLVFSTLHTNDAPSSITRLIDMGIDSFMVASSVLLICAQRLGRKLCKNCREKITVPPEKLISLGCLQSDLDQFGVDNIYRPNPNGCARCTRGYKGRFALLETLPLTEAVRRIVVSGGSAMDIKKCALAEGMITLRRVGMLNVLKGIASIENITANTLGDEEKANV